MRNRANFECKELAKQHVVDQGTTTNATGSGIAAPLFRACGRGGTGKRSSL
jgi:hypothetical protein